MASKGDKNTMKKTIKTVCQASHSECGVLVTVENGSIINIRGDPEHPMNKGFICPKGAAYSEFVSRSESAPIATAVTIPLPGGSALPTACVTYAGRM